MNKHIVRSYDGDLKVIRNLIKQMYDATKLQLSKASETLINRNIELANKIRSADKEINSLELAVKRKIVDIMALRQPMGIDLRQLVGELQIVNELERIGDYARNIAVSVGIIANYQISPSVEDLLSDTDNILCDTTIMFNKAMTAFFISDYLSALELYKMNKIINSSCALLVEKYLSYAEKNTSDIRVCMHMISILNQAERIGDRSVNIAGSLYFIVKGNEYTQNK